MDKYLIRKLDEVPSYTKAVNFDEFLYEQVINMSKGRDVASIEGPVSASIKEDGSQFTFVGMRIDGIVHIGHFLSHRNNPIGIQYAWYKTSEEVRKSGIGYQKVKVNEIMKKGI